MPKSRIIQSFFVSIAVLISQSALGGATPPLTIDDYLSQVQKSDPGYRGFLQESSAAIATSEKAVLIFRPEFFTQLQYIDNTLNTQAPSIQGTSYIQKNIAAGVRGQTPYGLGLSIGVDSNQSILFNTDPTLVPFPNLTNTYIVPQFNLSLWQNFWGSVDRANQKMSEAQDLATAYGNAYQARAALVDAESKYWKLAVTREIVKVQKESAERARVILEYDSQKARRHLVDPSDLLLAQAAVKGKDLELRSILVDEKSYARALNAARGLDSDEVSEELLLPSLEVFERLEPLKRGVRRGDVKAAEEASIAQSAGSEMARQKLLPDLSVYGSIFTVGLNLSFPLDFGTTSSVRDGYARQAAAADLTFQKKVMDEQAEWKDLVTKFTEAKERLTVAMELEEIQREKFENGRKRRARGLTIEDQVFQYELDYLNASLTRVQIEGMILGLRTQMKLYGSDQ